MERDREFMCVFSWRIVAFNVTVLSYSLSHAFPTGCRPCSNDQCRNRSINLPTLQHPSNCHLIGSNSPRFIPRARWRRVQHYWFSSNHDKRQWEHELACLRQFQRHRRQLCEFYSRLMGRQEKKHSLFPWTRHHEWRRVIQFFLLC